MSTRLRAVVWRVPDEGNRTIEEIYEVDWTGHLIDRTPSGRYSLGQRFLEFVERRVQDGLVVEVSTKEE